MLIDLISMNEQVFESCRLRHRLALAMRLALRPSNEEAGAADRGHRRHSSLAQEPSVRRRIYLPRRRPPPNLHLPRLLPKSPRMLLDHRGRRLRLMRGYPPPPLLLPHLLLNEPLGLA